MDPSSAHTGIVVIGRNEGERLLRCLASVRGLGARIVYVDSGSGDRSAERARALGFDVLELGAERPYSAARARNAGFARLQASDPALEFVHFVDGDCELAPGWLDVALTCLRARPEVAIVTGQLRERHPEASLFNRICDIEWQTIAGEITGCGGIFLIRAADFLRTNGLREDLVAGEEPELCFRLRAQGRKVVALAEPMGSHDAAMTSVRQWWRRNQRTGLAYALGHSLHGRSPERYRVKKLRSIWFWGCLLPAAAVLAGCLWSPWLLLGLPVVYLGQIARIAASLRRGGMSAADARLYALETVAGKWPQLQGVVQFLWLQARGRTPRLLEYK